MRKSVVALCFAVGAFFPSSGFGATFLVSPYTSPSAEARFDFTKTEIHYRIPEDTIHILRDIESLSWGYETFFATVGYVSKTDLHEFELAPEQFGDEPGYVIAVGARGPIWCAGEFSVELHAQFHTLNEKLVHNDISYSLQSLELLTGADLIWSSAGWSLHAGFDAVPYSSIDVSLEALDGMERTDFLVGRIGGRVALGPVFLEAEVSVLGAEGARIGLSYDF